MLGCSLLHLMQYMQLPIYIVFPQTIRNWNKLPDSLISSTEMSDDCVSKFTSLQLVRVNPLSRSSPIPEVWYCQFDVSPVNYSDSDLFAELVKYSFP